MKEPTKKSRKKDKKLILLYNCYVFLDMIDSFCWFSKEYMAEEISFIFTLCKQRKTSGSPCIAKSPFGKDRSNAPFSCVTFQWRPKNSDFTFWKFLMPPVFLYMWQTHWNIFLKMSCSRMIRKDNPRYILFARCSETSQNENPRCRAHVQHRGFCQLRPAYAAEVQHNCQESAK